MALGGEREGSITETMQTHHDNENVAIGETDFQSVGTDIDSRKAATASWFAALRDDICATFETIETELDGTSKADQHAGSFIRKGWNREGGGGGEISLMKGRVFEKVGVNISVVHGEFSEEFRANIPSVRLSMADSGLVEFRWSPICIIHMYQPRI